MHPYQPFAARSRRASLLSFLMFFPPLCRLGRRPPLPPSSPPPRPHRRRPCSSPRCRRSRLATAVAAVAAPRLAPVIVAVVVAATVVARVAAARRCVSAVVARLVTRRSHTVIVACRQVCRYRVVGTLPAVVLALALPSAPAASSYLV